VSLAVATYDPHQESRAQGSEGDRVNAKEYVEDAAKELEKVANDLRKGSATIIGMSIQDYSRRGEYRSHQVRLTIMDAKGCDVEVYLPVATDGRRVE